MKGRSSYWTALAWAWVGQAVLLASRITWTGSLCTYALQISQPTSTSSNSCRESSKPDLFRLQVSILEDEGRVIGVTAEDDLTAKERPRQKPQSDSARLIKAKQLLEQFTNGRDESSNAKLLFVETTLNGDIETSSSAFVKPLKKQFLSSTNKQKKDTDSNGSKHNVVPEQLLWANGHLQGGNYVTRWARGVKVAEPLVKYDPVVAEKVLFRQPAKWLVRNTQIAFPMGLWAAGVVTDFLMGRSKWNRRQRAKQLLNAISNLGPAIIKGGQALSSRPDLLPAEYLDELQKLQHDIPRFSNEVSFQTVQEELGVAFEKIFELVEEEPIAAASIGQVFKCRLISNGDTVALKIQRPKCEEIIALDLYILRWWSGVYNQIFKVLNRDIDLQSIIDDFGELIYREIDYVAEAANAQRFNELYAGVTDVFVPKIYSELTTSKVLTMEWVDGFRLTDATSLAQYGLEPSKLVNTLVQCSLRQVLENGYFHADPHAGNLLACPDGRLCYLDFGMMSFADSQQRNGFLLAVVHIVNRDWSALVMLYQKLGFIPEGTDLKPIEIALDRVLPDVLNAEIAQLNFKNVVNKLGDIMYTYPFSLPPFYIAIIRCLGVLEGLAIQVDPQARIISKAYPYVASRVLTDPQDDLQEALRKLALTSEGKVRWSRLESLLEEAKYTSDYDVAAALDVLTSFLISDEGDSIIDELAKEIVEAADSLGAETYSYVFDVVRALSINDEVAAVGAFRLLGDILHSQDFDGFDGVGRRVQTNLREILPEPTTSMQRFGRILSLLGMQGGQTDPAKFVPILRKLGQEPRIQRTLNEITAKLGERMLSRGLRATFGLPPPVFSSGSLASTVTEDKIK